MRRALEAKAKNVKEPHSHNLQATQENISEEAKEFPSLKSPALELLCKTFELSSFERDILLLCAGMEFDGGWALLCAEAQGDLQKAYPTFSLALAALPNPHWGALIPEAPLRCWRLIEIGAGNSLTTSLLRIDEQVLHYLAGAQHLDERLRGLAEPVSAKTTLVPSHQQIAQQLAATWLQSDVQAPVVQLCGEEGASKKAIAAAACHQLQLNLYALCGEALSVETSQR